MKLANQRGRAVLVFDRTIADVHEASAGDSARIRRGGYEGRVTVGEDLTTITL